MVSRVDSVLNGQCVGKVGRRELCAGRGDRQIYRGWLIRRYKITSSSPLNGHMYAENQ